MENKAFDYSVQYGVNFRLRDVLTKDKSSDFGYIVDDGSGRRMYLSVVGTLDEPEFKLDPKARRDARKEKIKQEKNTIKSILNKEFGLFKNSVDTSKTSKSKTAKPKIEIEWEDEDDNPESKEEKKPKKKKKIPKWIQKITGTKEDGKTTTF